MSELVHPKNKLNDLSAPEWISRTVSVFVQKGLGKNSDEAQFERQHPAPFSFTDITRFVEFFTKRGQHVLDPFGGVGSTAKACLTTGRNVTSVELSAQFSAVAADRLSSDMNNQVDEITCRLINKDIRDCAFQSNEFDLIVTSPPYWGILDKIDHKAGQERLAHGLLHNYGENRGDLSKIEDYNDFVSELSVILKDLSESVRDGGHAVIIVGDFRHKSRYYMFHADLARALEASNKWILKGIKIIYQKSKRVFPYGYPYSYVPNLHHQYALILQKA